jgi:hypothetical protein
VRRRAMPPKVATPVVIHGRCMVGELLRSRADRRRRRSRKRFPGK